MDYYRGELYQEEGKMHGLRYRRWWTDEGNVFWLDWDKPVSHNSSLCYGVNKDVLLTMRGRDGIKFLIKESEFNVPTDRQLKEMKADGWWNEKIYNRPNEPMQLYYFKI